MQKYKRCLLNGPDKQWIAQKKDRGCQAPSSADSAFNSRIEDSEIILFCVSFGYNGLSCMKTELKAVEKKMCFLRCKKFVGHCYIVRYYWHCPTGSWTFFLFKKNPQEQRKFKMRKKVVGYLCSTEDALRLTVKKTQRNWLNKKTYAQGWLAYWPFFPANKINLPACGADHFFQYIFLYVV